MKIIVPCSIAGEKGIALGLIETVALVQHEIGTLAVQFQIVAGGIDGMLDIRHARVDGVELDKLPIRGQSDDIGERSLSAAGRAPENAASQLIGGDGAP